MVVLEELSNIWPIAGMSRVNICFLFHTVFLCLFQAQLATSTSTLSATREEVKKLELQLKHTVADSEAIAAMLNKKHSAVVKSLEEKVLSH